MDMHAFIQAEALIHQFRKTIPGSSHTARSIDRNDPWNKVAAFAKGDGYTDMANKLEHIWVEKAEDFKQ
ncbi:MAG: hypothetical protein ACYC2R_14285 [Burkholderiales bacterium]|nr:hypothetical protein [Sulfuricellaceae bacterium]